MSTKSKIVRKAALAWSMMAVAIAFPACAGKKIAKDQVESVKKVAVVGFALQQRMPNTGSSVLAAMSSSSNNNPMGMSLHPAPIAKPAEHARIMYDTLEKELEKGMSWKVLSRKDLARNAEYASFFQEKTRQPQFRPQVSGENVEMFIPDGIVESFLLNSMNAEDRRELIKKLGVDAIAVATVQIELENRGGLKKLVGAGDFHPVAKLGFKLYNATQEDPIWMDLNADGAETEAGVDHALGFANVDAINKQAILTADSAIKKLIVNYRN